MQFSCGSLAKFCGERHLQLVDALVQLFGPRDYQPESQRMGCPRLVAVIEPTASFSRSWCLRDRSGHTLCASRMHKGMVASTSA